MTDMERKPNGWNLPINQMTDEEWKDYFECRKKYDIKLSVDEEKTQYVDDLMILLYRSFLLSSLILYLVIKDLIQNSSI